MLHATCHHCSFAPFCSPEPESARHCKQVSLAVKQYLTLQKREAFYMPKSKFKSLYAIRSGAIKTYQTEADGKELVRGFYFAGEVLGYEAIYTGHYEFSAVALSETEICEIPYEKFLDLLNSKPDFQKHILNLLSQQLNMGAYLVSTTAEQRLAAFLLDLATRLHFSEVKLTFNLPMSRQDIGNYLRLTAETISRICSRLHKNKIIATDHKKVAILQPEALKQMADGLYLVEAAS